MIRRLFFLSLGAWACGEEPPPAPFTVPVIEGHAAAAPGDFERFSFPCCGQPPRTEALLGLVALGERLAADDLAGSQVAARDIAEAARAPEVAAFVDAAEFGVVATKADELAGAADLPTLRAGFQELVDRVLALAQASPGGTYTFAMAYCPMKPGSWVQAREPLANPYYGAAMLRCGSFQGLPGGSP